MRTVTKIDRASCNKPHSVSRCRERRKHDGEKSCLQFRPWWYSVDQYSTYSQISEVILYCVDVADGERTKNIVVFTRRRSYIHILHVRGYCSACPHDLLETWLILLVSIGFECSFGESFPLKNSALQANLTTRVATREWLAGPGATLIGSSQKCRNNQLLTTLDIRCTVTRHSWMKSNRGL